jgi:RND family efflux transporter MFP subunit
LCLSALAGLGCNQQAKTGSAPGGEKPKVEAELAFITLAPNEVASLQIETKKITPQPVKERLELTGWVVAKQGHEVTLTAPVAGYVVEPTGAKSYVPPVPGQHVKADQLLFRMKPVLTPLEDVQFRTLKVGVDTELEKAREWLRLSEQEAKDMKAQVESKAKPKQELDRAQTRLKHADQDYQLAQKKAKLLTLAEVDVDAKRAGTVAVVNVSPGQYVPAAAPLVTLIDLDTVWVRVPVPEHDLQQVDRNRPATVVLRSPRANIDKNAKTEERAFEAVLKSEAPLVDPTRHTVDLIYEVSPKQLAQGKRGHFARDLMVTVLVPLGEDRPESAVPYSAVVYDAHGNAWVYVDRGKAKSGKHQYERRGVNVGARVRAPVEGRETDCVVVRPTLAAGESVVTFGAGVLFSREFYKPPVNP